MTARQASFSFSTPQGKTDVFYSDSLILPEIRIEKGRENALYVCDENTFPLLCRAEHFSEAVPAVVLPAGDEHKNIQAAVHIAETAIQHELDRQAVFIAFGGGVVCDITAFAASLYMRGVQCILIPTTVLAMADASIGGKTAVNLAGCKNLIGSFHAASAILFCFQALDTLPEAEYRSGLAEILKTAALCDAELYRMFSAHYAEIMKRETSYLSVMIRRAAEAKARIVETDFTEHGIRSFLNFGHTFGHALESLSGFSVSHGDAVAWGISRALAVGTLLGITDPHYAEQFNAVLRRYGWHTEPVYQGLCFTGTAADSGKSSFADRIIELMKKDKKSRNGAIRLVLQEAIQKNRICEVAEQVIREVLR